MFHVRIENSKVSGSGNRQVWQGRAEKRVSMSGDYARAAAAVYVNYTLQDVIKTWMPTETASVLFAPFSRDGVTC